MANNSALLGLEARLWEAADALRGSMDVAEYKHVVIAFRKPETLKQAINL